MPRVYLTKVHINSQGYDDSGCYWGAGQPLYCADHDDWDRPIYTRADNREHAKDIIRKRHPSATFFK